MTFIKRSNKAAVVSCLAAAIASPTAVNNAFADETEGQTDVLSDKWMLRLGAYIVDGADTTVAVNTPVGVGTIIDYQRDLGGEDSATIPRIDAFYRFNERHRIDFTWFSIDRQGERTLAVDVTIGDETFSESETVLSDIKYELYGLRYQYSFYRSPKVELGLSAGLNITEYDLKFQNATGDKAESAGLTVPLPLLGLRMVYAITPKWYVRYVSEAFFIEFDDSFKGALLNYELSTEYRIFRNFALGVGFARISLDADVSADDWQGKLTDSYRGLTAFGSFYF